jgi:uncharacterized damage-inducible protein DinB
MSQIDLIVEQLKLAFDGEAWHGPALAEILDGVDARTAAARPMPAAHSIWELTLHVTAWERVILRRLRGETVTLSDEENFRHFGDTSEANWQLAIGELRDTHSELIRSAAALPDERLNDQVPGKPYNLLFMLQGAVQHAAYHGGQMALLRRLRQ